MSCGISVYDWSWFFEEHERRFVKARCAGNERRVAALQAVHVLSGVYDFGLHAAAALHNGLVRGIIFRAIRSRQDLRGGPTARSGDPMRYCRELASLRNSTGEEARARRRNCYRRLSEIALDIAAVAARGIR